MDIYIHTGSHQEEGVVGWVCLPAPEIFLGRLATMESEKGSGT